MTRALLLEGEGGERERRTKRGGRERKSFSPSSCSSSNLGKEKQIKESYRAVLKQPVENRAIRLSHAAQVEPPHLRQVLVLVVRRHRLEEFHVVVGVELLDLRLGARLGAVEHHRLFEVVVRDQGMGEADAVRPHGVAAAVVERAWRYGDEEEEDETEKKKR